MNAVPAYHRILRSAFERRLERNPRYSLRAFATILEVDSSVCSQLLSGRRVPSLSLAEKLVDRLNLDPQERTLFLQSLGQEKMKAGLKRVNPQLRALALSSPPTSDYTRKELSLDHFQSVANWYYYAILELTKLPEFEESPKWIARRLGIQEPEARIALERLLELQMIERRDGKLVKTHHSFHAADPHLTTRAHRRRQREILQKSIDALERDPIHRRNHSAMTVAINPDLIPEAKKRISAFLQELSKFLESGGSREVYEIQLSLFSLQIPNAPASISKQKPEEQKHQNSTLEGEVP